MIIECLWKSLLEKGFAFRQSDGSVLWFQFMGVHKTRKNYGQTRRGIRGTAGRRGCDSYVGITVKQQSVRDFVLQPADICFQTV